MYVCICIHKHVIMQTKSMSRFSHSISHVASKPLENPIFSCVSARVCACVCVIVIPLNTYICISMFCIICIYIAPYKIVYARGIFI